MRKIRKTLLVALLIVFLLALSNVLASALSAGEVQEYSMNNSGKLQVVGNIEFTQVDNIITVTHNHACKVGYLDGEKYRILCANENDDGSYSFALPDGATDVLIVVSGDVNFDGRVTAADVARLNAHIIGKNTIGADELFAGDVDGDGNETASDLSKMVDDILRSTHLAPIGHHYLNGWCIICGNAQSTKPTITINNPTGTAGSEIMVTFDMTNSPSLYAMRLILNYDATALELISAESGEAVRDFSYTSPSRLKNGCAFMWYANDPVTANGTVLTLVFKISNNAEPGTYSITMTCDSSNTYDADDKDVELVFAGGNIVVND